MNERIAKKIRKIMLSLKKGSTVPKWSKKTLKRAWRIEVDALCANERWAQPGAYRFKRRGSVADGLGQCGDWPLGG